MSTEHVEDQHDMINEGETPDELLESGVGAASEEEAAVEEKRKKNKKLQLIVWGGFAVLLVGFVGFKILGATPAPNKERAEAMLASQATKPRAIQAPVGMPQPPQAPVGMPQPPQAQVGMPQPLQAQVGMPQPLQAQVGMPQPLQAPVGMPQPLQAPVGMPQPLQAQVGMPQPLQAPVGMPQPLQALVAQGAVVTPIVPTNTVNSSGKTPETQWPVTVASQEQPPVEGFARGFFELTKKLDELKGMFARFDEMNIGDRLAKLEARVGALEGGASKSAVRSAPHARSKSLTPRKPVQNVQLGGGEELLFTRPTESRSAMSSRSPDAPTRQAPVVGNRGYALQAVIPGRIWIKDADGNSKTFENGEILPDSAKILRIDPDRGDVVTSKGVLRFDPR